MPEIGGFSPRKGTAAIRHVRPLLPALAVNRQCMREFLAAEPHALPSVWSKSARGRAVFSRYVLTLNI
jgi:hypothetical protein